MMCGAFLEHLLVMCGAFIGDRVEHFLVTWEISEG